MALNKRYITTKTLEELFVDRQTGEALSNGTVTFYKDNTRNALKDVYQLVGELPDYGFQPLPNPITLNANGTFANGGNNIALYYMPYESDSSDNVELYYVVVKNELDEVQFTREAWPSFDEGAIDGATEGTLVNEIQNSQFVDVSFGSTLDYDYSGATTTTLEIAPEWDLVFAHDGAGTITIARTGVAGNLNIATNPAFTLTVTPGANITQLILRQRLSSNSSIFTPVNAGAQGYVNTGILLYENTSATINYVPSDGATQLLFNNANANATPAYFSNTVQLVPSNNTDTGDDAYVDIDIVLSNTVASRFSSVQVVGLSANAPSVDYRQDTANKQRSDLFNYYNPLLQFKPINSYLVGWDFALNPAQALGYTVTAIASGANTSNYIWDNTIVFQTADSAFSYSQTASGAFQLACAVEGAQAALIQYINVVQNPGVLNEYLSSMVEAIASEAIDASISLWWTDSASLPDMGANASVVATLDAVGRPATFGAGTWTEIPRTNLWDAQFTVGTTVTDDLGLAYNRYGFSGWKPTEASRLNANWVAIVVGTGAMTLAKTLSIQSISLVPGLIPTIPAPLTRATVLAQCQALYEKSFDIEDVPAQNTQPASAYVTTQLLAAATAGGITPYVAFKTAKWRTPLTTDIVTFNPRAANALIRNETIPVDCNPTAVLDVSQYGFTLSYTTGAGSALGNRLTFHWTCDVRYGY